MQIDQYCWLLFFQSYNLKIEKAFCLFELQRNLKTSHIIKPIVNSHLVSGHRLIYRSGHMLTFFLNHTAMAPYHNFHIILEVKKKL